MSDSINSWSPRDHLAHVVADLKVNGCSSLLYTLLSALRAQSAHTLIYETPPDRVDAELLWHLQAAGANALHVDRVTPECLESLGVTGAILYNLQDRPEVGKAVPSIYYSYGVYDESTGADIVVPCSEYACTHRRNSTGSQAALDPEWVIPPVLQTRQLRRLKPVEHPFTIGLFTSGSDNKYPCKFAMELLSKLPEDIHVSMTELSQYVHPGMQLAIDDRKTRTNNKMRSCPVRIHAPLRYVIYADVIVYATSDSYNEPYGKLVAEALALGKPVVCQRTGVFKETLEHGVQALLYDTVDEALDHIERIRTDTKVAEQLGANAQLWASWQDVSVHLGKLKGIMRMIGA